MIAKIIKNNNYLVKIFGIFVFLTIILLFNILKFYNNYQDNIMSVSKNNDDLYFAFYVDNNLSKTMPQKGEGYVLDTEKTVCTNGVKLEFDRENWTIKLFNMTTFKTKCNLYFKTQPTAVEEILAMGETEELKYDGTVDNNLRYVGADPNNYVSFNNELWRIIGVMNNIDDGNGNKVSRLKIVKDNYIYYNEISWDNSNNYVESDMQSELNDSYFPSIEESSKKLVGDAIWNIGSVIVSENISVEDFYNQERKFTSDEDKPLEWVGKIGLMYPSDYGFATSGGVTTSREECLNKELFYWDNSEVSDCYNNDWIYDKSDSWTITPVATVNDYVFIIDFKGKIDVNLIDSSAFAVPSAYLLSNVFFQGGNGTKQDPYILNI